MDEDWADGGWEIQNARKTDMDNAFQIISNMMSQSEIKKLAQ